MLSAGSSYLAAVQVGKVSCCGLGRGRPGLKPLSKPFPLFVSWNQSTIGGIKDFPSASQDFEAARRGPLLASGSELLFKPEAELVHH